MVVGHFFIAAHLFCENSRRQFYTTDCGGNGNQIGNTMFHILS
jgi:hypothetical protein